MSSTRKPALTHVTGSNFLSFLNQQTQTDLDRLHADFAVVGLPFGSPYHMQGVASGASTAPAAIREKSHRFGNMLGQYDFDFQGELLDGRDITIVDCGDVIADPRDIDGNNRRATGAVRAILDRGAFPIVLGGDDSIPAFAIAAFADIGPLTVVQIDAHIDYKDAAHGGIRDGYSSPMRRSAELPFVEKIVHVGIRGLGSAHRTDVEATLANGNAIVPARVVHQVGIQAVLDEVAPGANVFITLDCDGFDPAVMPGTSCPMPGGLTYWQGADLITGLVDHARVVGINTAEHFPALDIHGITSLTLARLLVTLIGAKVRKAD
jgi:agmatinase